MKDNDRTNKQLIDELTDARQRITDLEALVFEYKSKEETLKQNIERLRNILDKSIITLASTVETKDPYSIGHQGRVAKLACAMAEEMGFSEEQIEEIRLASLVHDIGKISVPADLLTKPDGLVDNEYVLIKNHPQNGYDILEKVEFPDSVARIVLQHHERINGTGYPKGLSGEDIVMGARILSVADVVEAIATQRSYRKALGIDKALNEIKRYKDFLYDPDAVDACLRLFRDKRFKWDK
jgi:putative nucleotidyltransferase with HDIG domain